MWNLSALAAKAQEAAARIEKKLDESVGLKEVATPSDAAADAAAATTTNDDCDDDFFSDDRHQHLRGAREQRNVVEAGDPGDPPTPPHNRFAATSTESSDLVVEEEMDFGGDVDHDKGAGDGWDDVDEFYDGDDDDENGEGAGAREDESALARRREEDAEDDALLHQPADANAGPHGEIDCDDDYGVSSTTPPRAEDGDVAAVGPGGGGEGRTDGGIDGGTRADDGDDGGREADGYVAHRPTPSADDDIPTSADAASPPTADDAERPRHLAAIADLESRLRHREGQLTSKSEQIASLSAQHESEISKLRHALSETKEEARKRVTKSRERVEEMQARLAEATRRADAAGGVGQGQSDLIAELRAEGEKLARKQGQMEQLVRNARGEARDLEERLEIETAAREKEATRADALEKEVKSLKEGLSSARKGESQSKKLEGELVTVKEESEKQRASNTVLDQQLKLLRDENRSLRKEVQEARAGAALELEGESTKLRKERDDMLGDLEGKLRTSEREANVREDALRHEVSELRKRWQDAVRRAEDLSMDVQHSTAPLMRQLESTERQNRARAAAWAEVETKLRSDLEDHIIQLENVTKERNNLVSSEKRLQRLLKEKEEEIASSRETIGELSAAIKTLETRAEESEEEGKRMKQELVVAERKASEGASKVRSEMMLTVVESEERYRSQIDALKEELNNERHRRGDLEKQLDDLVESVTAAEFAPNHAMCVGGQRSPARGKKLLSATDQASILQDTLGGFDSDVDDDNKDHEHGSRQVQGQGSSFAAMEQLSLRLKGAKVELDALRKQLITSEETRASLSEELGEARQAVEKLPLFEQRVSELTMEVKLKDMEIQGLQDDIADVRFLYRTQLDALLEEKATSSSLLMQSEQAKTHNAIVFDDDCN